MSEEIAPKRTLWMLECYNGIIYELVPLYATSEEDARQQAEAWIEREYTNRPIQFVGLRAYPGGFLIHRRRLEGEI